MCASSNVLQNFDSQVCFPVYIIILADWLDVFFTSMHALWGNVQ